MKQLVMPTSRVSGNVTGYLIIERDQGMTNAYQEFEAAADLVFPIKL
jgi:hypothetical protein